MTETQTRTQPAIDTEQDFFAGYRPISPTADRIKAPEFMPYSFDVSAPVETPTEMYQTPAFEVEKQYTFDTSSYEPAYRAMETPSIQRNSQIAIHEEESRVQANTYAKAKLNARGKIAITVYSIVVAIIVALCIYNAVAINGLNSDIAYKDGIVASQTEVIASLQNTYNSLGEDEVIISATNGEFKVPEESDIVRIGGFEMAERTAETSQTNWFEEFCEAIRKLFS